ncbi:tRNA epoxyqueuosine(34) reductase QueG [Zhongshania sp.]|jgi:epoxyqueuosine reductase|uniref:tRNA epoxyqueuosine(34) reductase QueG n=1 Tax=Zhongshania sp. TaxID=1971902 RepID=UPI001B535C8C|nr:tRNA epoxyqueuosine(34) reductase QueG [Zhongshania sp.]MBQ0796827.1 tRNA epoxyqueuosine(34) reductase QueG [Zhongshania sp.]
MSITSTNLDELAQQIKAWGRELGFAHIGISPATNAAHAEHLRNWLAKQYHGDMSYMAEREGLRAAPAELLPGTVRVISARLDYLPDGENCEEILNSPSKAYISRYALGRDYHKLIRKRLSQLAEKISAVAGGSHRAFVDSAPVLERGFAEQAGLGWIGKNSMLINSKAGSWFFLGEIYTDLPLPTDPPQEAGHCGTCRACLDDCPTGAIVAPYQVDARRCISYLTIELKDSIPEDLRPLMGNRVFGCDDCQLVCPWNKFAQTTTETDFSPRHQLDNSELVSLFLWTEQEFLDNTAGSAIRRIGYQRWLRNLAVGIGNAPANDDAIRALHTQYAVADEMAREHITWALNRLQKMSSK